MKRTIFKPHRGQQPIVAKQCQATDHGTRTPTSWQIASTCWLFAAALLLSRSALLWQAYKCIQALLAYCVWLATFDLSEPMAYIMFVLSTVFLLAAFGAERTLTHWRTT